MSLKLAQTSRLRLMHPALKAACAMIAIGLVLGMDSTAFSLFVLSAALLTAGLTLGRGFIEYIHLSCHVLPFILCGAAACGVVIGEPGPDAYFAFPVFSSALWAGKASVLFAAGLMAKSSACVACLLLTAASTPTEHFLWLLEAMHAPKILTESMLFTLRFIFVIASKADSLYIAQKARMGRGGLAARLRAAGALASSVFVGSWLRTAAIANAMESRGYNGSISLTSTRFALRPKAAFACLAWCAIIAGGALALAG